MTAPIGPRFVLANALGCHVATIDTLEAAMSMILIEARWAFIHAADLFDVLAATLQCWRGQRHEVRATYASLRVKLGGTGYPLLRRRYGFRSSAGLVVVIR